MTTIIDGSAGITFPSGSNPQAAPSKVLQVVQGYTNTQVTTTGSTFVATGLTASITPLFSTSKILILFNVSTGIVANATGIGLQLYKNGSQIYNVFPYAEFLNIGTTVSQLNITSSSSYLDSPATTSSTTYAIYFGQPTGSGTIYSQINSNFSTITLMEIAQ